MANEVANLIFKADTSDIEKAVKRLGYLSDSANDAEKEVGDLAKMADKADDKVDKLGKKTKKTTTAMNGLAKAAKNGRGKLVGFAAGLVGIGAAVGFTKKFIDVNRQFSIMNGQLLTATGSASAAADQFDRLKKFAATTPFDLAQSVDGFVKLKNLGLDPSESSMRSFGNTASAMGKSLNQMVEAVADAATGEFERLKEFGIKASKQGDKVTFVFAGVTTTVANNAAAITGYLKNIGEEKFGDAMSTQAASFTGAISNLGDSFDDLFRRAGEGGALDTMSEAFRSLSESLQSKEAVAGAQAIAKAMAGIIEGGAGSLVGLASFIDKLANLATIEFSIFSGFSMIDKRSAEGVEHMKEAIVDAKDAVADLTEELNDAEVQLKSQENTMDSQITLLKGVQDGLAKVGIGETVTDSIKIYTEKVRTLRLELQLAQQNVLAANEAYNSSFANLTTTPDPDIGGFSPVRSIFDEDQSPIMASSTEDMQGTDPFADVQTASQIAEEAKQAEIDRIKALELEFQTWKGTQAQSELDIMKEQFLMKEEATQEHFDKIIQMEVDKAEGRNEMKADLDNKGFLQQAAQGGNTLKFIEKMKKNELKVEDMTGKQKAKMAIGLGGDILAHAAKNSETAFKMQKGLKIATTIQDTYSAAMGAYSSLAPIPFVGPALGIAAAGMAIAGGMANVKAIQATQFNKSGAGGSVAKPTMPSGGGGGGVSAASVADIAPMQEAANDEQAVAAPSVVNVTVDGTIDPTGARRIIEAINEATEDGLEINALVGT